MLPEENTFEVETEENIKADTADSPKVFNALDIKMLQSKKTGYARPFMPDLPPEGNVLAANFRRENMIGQYLNTINFDDFDKPELMTEGYDYLEHIPIDLYDDYGHMYAMTLNPTHAEALTGQLRDELRDRQIMANKPWRSFLSGFMVNFVDPTFLLPGGTLYKNTKAARGVAASMLSVAGASAAGQTLQEITRHQTQLTAELDESFYNVLGAGLIGSVMGGLGGAYVNGAIFKKTKTDAVKGLANESPIGATMTPKESISAQKTRDPEYEKEVNSLYGGTPTAALGKFLGYATQKLTPFGRLVFSPFPSSRAIVNELMEHNLLINANLPGKKKIMGPDGKEIEVERPAFEKPAAVETDIKQLKRGMFKSLIDYQKIFYQQAGITGLFKGVKQRFKSEGLSLPDYEKAVWRSIVTGKESENSAVKQASDLIMNKFFNPVRDEYIRLGIFSEDINVKTAANYFMRVYNREKIRDPAQRIKTKTKFESYIKKNNEELIALQPQLEALERQVKKLELKRKITPEARAKQIEVLKKQIKELVPQHLYDSSGNIRKVIDPDYYGVEADKIIDNILGMGQEDKFNPLLASLPGKRTNPLRERKFLIPDSEIEDELITSFLEIAPMFINATAPNIGLLRYAKRIGLEEDIDARGYKIKLLEDDYKAAVAKNPNKEPKLYKRYQKDKSDVLALFDVLQGIYGLGPNVLDAGAARVVKNLSTWNYLRFMGQITAQAFTDLGSIGLKHGLFRTIHSGVIPMIREIAKGGYDKDFLNDLGHVCNTQIGYRLKGMIDQEQTVGQTGLFTKSLDTFSSAYGNMTLMNQWTDTMEFIAGKTSMARTLRAIDKWAETGSMPRKESTRLNELGIATAEYKAIHDQFKKHGGKTQGSYWVNWGKWDGDNAALNALDKFKKATLKEIDQTVIARPGLGEKPLMAHNKLGSLFFQFKGFSYAATNKMLISGLQRGDMEFYQGLIMLGTLSLMRYAALSTARGEEINLDYDNLFKEMIDGSGITGVFGNFYNTANKLGVIPGESVSRYRNRGVFASLGGPTVGAIEDSVDLLSKMVNSESTMNTNDMYKLLRFMPAQNYVFTHKLNKQVAKDFANYIEWEESPE